MQQIPSMIQPCEFGTSARGPLKWGRLRRAALNGRGLQGRQEASNCHPGR